MASAAVFFDKDGTLIRDVPYNTDPTRISFYPEAAFAVSALNGVGFDFYVISNQPGVAMGLFSERDLLQVRRTMEVWFHRHGTQLKDFLYCPHLPEATVPRYAKSCECRKPKPGLLYRAAEDHGIDLAHSWFLGDILDDVQAGRTAGCKTILIDNGNETEWDISPERTPDFIAADLNEAARLIIASIGQEIPP